MAKRSCSAFDGRSDFNCVHSREHDPSISWSAAEVALAFKDAYRLLNQRIGIFAALPLRALNQLVLQNRLHEIGQMEGSTAKAGAESATLTTTAFDRSSSQWLGISDLIAEPEGPSFILRTVAHRRLGRRYS